MDTIVKFYKNSFFKYIILTILLTTLTGCPEEISCDGGIYNNGVRFDKLSTITPLKEVYNVGDEVTYSLIIPSKNNYFDKERDIYKETKSNYGFLVMTNTQFTDNINEVVFIKGINKIDGNTNWYHLYYNPQNDNYELIFKVKFKRSGLYDIVVMEDITFPSIDYCSTMYLNTSTFGHDERYSIKFTVN